MNKPHKHATLIKKWADGAEMEYRTHLSDKWRLTGTVPAWRGEVEYRVAPDAPPKEVWVSVYSDYIGVVAISKCQAQRSAGLDCTGTYRYVLAEEQE